MREDCRARTQGLVRVDHARASNLNLHDYVSIAGSRVWMLDRQLAFQDVLMRSPAYELRIDPFQGHNSWLEGVSTFRLAASHVNSIETPDLTSEENSLICTQDGKTPTETQTKGVKSLQEKELEV
jgi:hypothetical protein